MSFKLINSVKKLAKITWLALFVEDNIAIGV